MRTLNNINSSFDSPSRPVKPALAGSHTRRSAPPANISTSASASSNKLAISSKPRPRTPTPKPQARPRFPSAGDSTSNSCTSPPLGYDDSNQQHVLALTTTKTSSRSTSSSSAPPASKMPPGDSRPRPPQLSAAAAKTVGRTPLTPKIASTAKGPSTAAPLVRRSTQNLPTGSSYREGAASPSGAYTANAITPRSGSRQSRAESNNTTPNGTPNPERDGWDPRAPLTSTGRQSLPRVDSSTDPSSKFFRASNGPNTSSSSTRPPAVSQKSATFFYANSVTAEPKRSLSPPTSSPYSPIITATPEPTSSKFFYANGVPDLQSRPSLPLSGPPSAGSSSPRLQTGRPGTSSSAVGHPNHPSPLPPRPQSPIKIAQPTPSILKNTGTPGLNSRPQMTSPPQIASPPPLAPPATVNSKRRVSIESTPRIPRGHARTGSVPSFNSPHSPMLPMSPPRQPAEPTPPPRSPGLSQPAFTMASILQVAEDLAEEEESRDDGSQPEVQSPARSTNSADPINELVANARRERKVQDLEITNASLEAINRTLERQLRKQTTEIRRYRRLSRSGHLSAVASAASSRVPSTALTDVPISLSDLSEEESSPPSDDEEHDSLEDSDLSMEDSTSLSDLMDPHDEKAMEKVMGRQRRDERRLQLDLSKHREILVDSQKINQSIKRCLNWTEILIKEGQKALEYKVRITDVDFGGHVLPPPNEDDDEEAMSQFSSYDQETGSAGLELPLPWEKSSQDRDSGIELQADGN
ncbi:hypothetical protein FZEAL_8081 [Fusarium zealandicum]|uniref:Uncharacterized protein n=1 Tax=Fusarium zealandicum TaxID=1053134 RepID=A0A8H4UES8_9HYPO|nr:hypothetical protein FZEAL_8081 [Fusarium zealandicum]